MKCLNKRAEAIFRMLIDGLGPGEHVTIENSRGTYMPLAIEVLSYERVLVGKDECVTMTVSLAHHYEQNGDLMADPDVEFLVTPLGVAPLTYQQDGLGVCHRWAWKCDGQWRFHRRGQADLAVFCGQWMKNIYDQQFDPRSKSFFPGPRRLTEADFRAAAKFGVQRDELEDAFTVG